MLQNTKRELATDLSQEARQLVARDPSKDIVFIPGLRTLRNRFTRPLTLAANVCVEFTLWSMTGARLQDEETDG